MFQEEILDARDALIACARSEPMTVGSSAARPM